MSLLSNLIWAVTNIVGIVMLIAALLIIAKIVDIAACCVWDYLEERRRA